MEKRDILRVPSGSYDMVHEYMSDSRGTIWHRWTSEDGTEHTDGSSEWKIAEKRFMHDACRSNRYGAIDWFKARGITYEKLGAAIDAQVASAEKLKRRPKSKTLRRLTKG